MPFYNQSFVYTYDSEQNQCKMCHGLFGELNEFTGELKNGNVIQCIRYTEYCISCCHLSLEGRC